MRHFCQTCKHINVCRHNKRYNGRALRKVPYSFYVSLQRKQPSITTEYVCINMLSELHETNFPVYFDHMVTETPGLRLSFLHTSTIVWEGLQCQNIYQSRLRALTHEADSPGRQSVIGRHWVFVADQRPKFLRYVQHNRSKLAPNRQLLSQLSMLNQKQRLSVRDRALWPSIQPTK